MKRFVLIAALLCLASDCEDARLRALDNGRMTLDDGTPMGPYIVPWYLTVEDSIDDQMVIDAMAWWNEQVGFVVYEMDEWSFSEVTVSSGYTGDEDADGVFRDLTHDDGMIDRGDIIVSSDILYDDDYAQAVLRHEMGHALGLADDPHSVDLNSVMSSPVIIGAELTVSDREILEAWQ
jgi:hypothetical protein